MGPVRRTINLVFALALTGGGGFMFFYLFLYAPHAKIGMIAGAGIATFLGLYWLWADYINADPRPEK
jgi:hypothetical protein